MVRHLRAWWRGPATLAWTLLIYLGWISTQVLGPLFPALARRGHANLRSLWARGIARLLGGRIEVRGSPPQPPFFLVSNHLSYLDIPILYSQLCANFLAKSEVAGWPLIGWLARSTGTLFINRSRKSDLQRVIAQVTEQLQAGSGIVVFPEGTSTKGERVLPFRASLFEVAIRTGSPVSYAAITYRTPAGCPPPEEVLCWWGDMRFLPHLYQLLTLPHFQAILTFGQQPIVATDRKALAGRAHEAVTRCFQPVMTGRAS